MQLFQPATHPFPPRLWPRPPMNAALSVGQSSRVCARKCVVCPRHRQQSAVRRSRAPRMTVPVAAAAAAPEAPTQPSEAVLDAWRSAEAVCFDVDSTFCEDESIDEIAAFLGVGDQVAALTSQAMGGSVRFEDALAARLGLMQPTQQQMEQFLEVHPPRLSKGIPELVAALLARGKDVFLVSGGFRQVIHPIAQSLGIPLDHVHANQILFNEDGKYAGFDANEFTSRSGGKAAAICHIKAKYGYGAIVMVGDGATDLEARQPDAASIFIGYGGVVVRPNIAAQSDWYIYSIQSLIDALG